MQIIHEAKETIIEEGRFGLGKFTANYVKTFALYPADSPNFGRVNERITRNPVEIKCADDPRGTLYVVIDKQSDTYFPVENGLRGSWSYIPEPAQPVDAGEAKERGDNE